jgi:DNA-binding winged helix-turn-helix (wHTH) protein
MRGTFRFGTFELDLAAYVLKAQGDAVRLERIPMEVLALLVQRAGLLVERSEIAAAVWGPDVFLEQEAAINTAVRKIRQVLGDDAAAPRFVQTVMGKGYRFIAAVESLAPARESAASGGQDRSEAYVVKVGGQEFVLHSGETVLGRDPAAGIYVDHPSVSRHHASLSIEPGRVRLQDLGSRNGTFLNGRRIDGSAEISEDAIIGLGPVTLVICVVRAPASTQSMGAAEASD